MNDKIPQNTLVVIADGARALLFRYSNELGAAKLRKEEELGPKNLNSDGPSGSRPVEQTRQQTNEATFAKQLARALFERSENGSYTALVLAADPQTLGQLRATLHSSVSEKIIMELNKDLTNQPVSEIVIAIE